jgi:hypothetical protein
MEPILSILSAFQSWAKSNPLVWGSIAFFLGIGVHILIDVRIVEPWKEKKAHEKRRKEIDLLKAEAANLRARLTGKLFSLSGVTTTIYVLDASLDGYGPHAITSRQVDYPAEAPSELADLYGPARAKWDQALAEGKIFAGARGVAPRAISVDRAGAAEEKLLRVDFSLSQGYVHDRAVADVFRALPRSVGL